MTNDERMQRESSLASTFDLWRLDAWSSAIRQGMGSISKVAIRNEIHSLVDQLPDSLNGEKLVWFEGGFPRRDGTGLFSMPKFSLKAGSPTIRFCASRRDLCRSRRIPVIVDPDGYHQWLASSEPKVPNCDGLQLSSPLLPKRQALAPSAPEDSSRMHVANAAKVVST
jgi:hypothetical protein